MDYKEKNEMISMVYNQLIDARNVLKLAREKAEVLLCDMYKEKAKTNISLEFLKKQDEYEKFEFIVDELRENMYGIEDLFKKLLLESNEGDSNN